MKLKKALLFLAITLTGLITQAQTQLTLARVAEIWYTGQVPRGINQTNSWYSLANYNFTEKGKCVYLTRGNFIGESDTTKTRIYPAFGGTAGTGVWSANGSTLTQGSLFVTPVASALIFKFFGANASLIQAENGIARMTADSIIFIPRDDHFKIALSSAGSGKVLQSDASGNASWATNTGGMSGLTTNYIPKATSSTTIGNSFLSEDGTQLIIPNGKYITGANTAKVRISFGTSGDKISLFSIAGDYDKPYIEQGLNSYANVVTDGGVTNTYFINENYKTIASYGLNDNIGLTRSGIEVQNGGGTTGFNVGGVSIKLATAASSNAVTANTDSYWASFFNAKNATYTAGVKNSAIIGGDGRTATANNTVYVPSLDISGVLKYVDGNQASGKVLQSDASGNATWVTPASGISGLTTNTIPVAASATTLTDSPLQVTGSDFKTNGKFYSISPGAVGGYWRNNGGVVSMVGSDNTSTSGLGSVEGSGYAGSGTLALTTTDNVSGNTGITINNTGTLSSILVNGSGSFAGVRYSSNYSANYTARSLIDKGYGDATYAPIAVSGTVTSIATGNGITGGTITSTGTLGLSGATGDIPSFSGTNTHVAIAGAASGKILQAKGVSTLPAYTTATYPATATTSGAYMRADGTNWITSTVTLPNSISQYVIPFATSANTIGVIGSVNNLTFVGDGVTGLGINNGGSTTNFIIDGLQSLAGLGSTRFVNDNTGTAGAHRLLISSGSVSAQLITYNQNYTTSGTAIASSILLTNTSAGGVSLSANNAAGDIRFYSGGTTERMTLTDAGILSIGNASPSGSYRLEVYDATLGAGANFESLGLNNANAMRCAVNTNTTTFASGVVANYVQTNTTTNNWAGFYLRDGNNFPVGAVSAQITNHTTHTGDLAFGTRGATAGALTEKVRIEGDGNVGIGTTTISAKLHVLSTTEQLRVGYDASNYYSTTVGSTGGVTFNAVGAGSAFTFSDKIIHSLPENLKTYTVATLPAGVVGDFAYVTDATAPTYLGALVGGGAVVCPVFYNGAAWVSH